MKDSIIHKHIILYTPAVISGLLLILCFPTAKLYFLAWVALVPFLVSLFSMNPKQSFTSGVFLGLPYFSGTLYWIYHSINHYGNVPLPLSIALVILLCSYLSLYTGIFALVFMITIKKTKFPASFLAPVYWVVLEFLRSYLFTGFPWSSIGYSQYTFLSSIQIADITGIYGISFLIVAVNGALADVFLIKKRTQEMPLFPLSHTIAGFSVIILFLIITFAYGHMRLSEERPGNLIKASIVQGNIEQDKKWEPSYQNTVLDIYEDLSLKAAESSPSLIIWPETAVPFFFETDIAYTKRLLEFQNQLNTRLLFGSVLIKEKTDDRYILSNSAVLLDQSGNVDYVYDKIHLVPFGEYIPLQKLLFFIQKLVVGIGDYTFGNTHIKAETPFGDFATVICYEVIFPGLVRKFYLPGGDFIVNITNDAWFGRTTGPYQHFSMAVFRAIENRKPLIRAANTGISGFIDSNGKTMSKTDLFQTTVLTNKLKTDTTRSFYTKYGDLFSYLCVVFSVIIMIKCVWKEKR